ncbi:phosphotransferase [Thermopolyspora sp. NPDC052614]|uniref:phosphotransferase enzyme family protein n=1 Tax=Thermopolyspora sp. NPDC052614 TaxID=3155682 RepID=UPI0034413B48
MKAGFSADRALHRLCGVAGVDSRGARLIRICANIVYHLPRANAVARISSAGTAPHARRAVRVAHWLQKINFPAVRVHSDVPDAVVVGGRVATFWQYLPQPAAPPQVVQLAALLRKLHAQTVPFPLPAWDPVADARDNLRRARGVLSAEDHRFLLRWCDRLEDELPTNRYALPYGLIHGDAWAGNLLWRGEDVVLCDLDQVCHGPREWDLVSTAVNALRFGTPPAEEFLTAYGFDVTIADGFPLLRQARELIMLTGALPALSSRVSIAREFGRRLASLRGFGSHRWTPYG